MNNSKTKSRGYLVAVLVLFLLALAAGYAAFSDTLTITGTANANGTFDVSFESCTASKKVGVASAEGVLSNENDTLTITVEDLGYPGAGAQFDVVIKNNGSVPAVIKSVTAEGITGSDNIIIKGLDVISESHEEIAAGGTCSFSFTVEWDAASDGELTDEEKTGISFNLVAEYEQADATPFDGAPSHTDA